MTEPARQYDVVPPRRPPIWRLALMLFFLGVVSLAMVVLARGCEASLTTVGPSDASRCVWIGEGGPSRSIHDGRCEMASGYIQAWPERKTMPLGTTTATSGYVSTIGGDGTADVLPDIKTWALAPALATSNGPTNGTNWVLRNGTIDNNHMVQWTDGSSESLQGLVPEKKEAVMMFAFQVIGVITVAVLVIGALFAPGVYVLDQVEKFGERLSRGLTEINGRFDRTDRRIANIEEKVGAKPPAS